jgi:catechol 2,3-dioxygenase-like lactoylglutathione lyase family enzyme
MFDRVGTVCIFVNDQDKAKQFYTETLGFELRQDVPMSAFSRWLAVAPQGAATEVILYKVDENWQHYKGVVGHSQGVTFNVKDMDALAKDLKAKGVRFAMEPEASPWGKQAIIMDAEDNRLVLVERP